MPPDRELTISGSFPDGALVVDHLRGREALSTPFELTVDLHSPDPDLDISALVGDSVTITVDVSDEQPRYFNGYVTRMIRLGTFDSFAHYQITVRPWLFLLSSRINSRVVQHKKVTDIVTDLFREHGFSDFEIAATGTYPEREFIVQYRESDFAFANRLLEREGIYYFFRHEKDKHVLVLADSVDAHQTVPEYDEVPFHPEGSTTPMDGESINRWQLVHQWRAGAYASRDFDFERPRADLTARRQAQAQHKKGDLEVFDYPAGLVVQSEVEGYVRARLEAFQADVEVANGSGDVRGLGAGNLFTLTDFPNEDENKEYLITAATYDARNNEFQTGGGQEGYFRFSFTAVDSQVPYRPRLLTSRPRVEGPQTAIVVGEKGEEITTDKYGRVKVQFHWDREGAKDQDSSCWVRVAQVWAGSGWGAMHIPRIGQEVIVEFLDGDPDRPIITGAVYNADNMPPYTLPENKTQSGIKSRSTKGAGPSNFNEIRFEDKKGSEELHIEAERDQSTHVKRNQTISVDGDRSVSVGGNESVSVTGTRTSTIHKKDKLTCDAERELWVTGTDLEDVTGHRTEKDHGGREVTVEQGDALTVVGSDKTDTIHGKYDVTADTEFQVMQGANKLLIKESVDVDSVGEIHLHNPQSSVDLKGGVLNLTSASEIVLECGSSKVSLKSDGTIEINGVKVSLNGGGAGVELTAAGAKVSGTKVTASGTAMTEITGAVVKIN
ncbi:MAG TPA: type VI secretion system tip protein TssI/VgrG [Polyangia bacterium]|nr:type VI secretion system tip protein TssI/VgrG [Polyangia bacterium]